MNISIITESLHNQPKYSDESLSRSNSERLEKQVKKQEIKALQNNFIHDIGKGFLNKTQTQLKGKGLINWTTLKLRISVQQKKCRKVKKPNHRQSERIFATHNHHSAQNT